MEVVAATPNGGGVSPFHNHDICEWSCVDSLTGVLERARWETDHWTANTNNSTHKYGKVVDCRARSGVDGNLQQEARRQLEVFQSQIPGGRLQVIKTHSVSSSKWTNTFSQESHDLKPFEDLHLKLNPLDVTSQKSKAIVGRSNVGRRPPSRQQHHHQQRNRNEPSTTTSKNHDDTSTSSLANLHRVSRLCNQIREGATKPHVQTPFVRQERRQNGVSGSGGGGTIAIGDLETNHQLKRNEELPKPTTRTSDTSSEDSHLSQSHYSDVFNDKEHTTKSIEDLEDLEKLRDWRRTSKLRRSFQHPRQSRNTNSTTTATKPADLPASNGSVRKIREDIEKGRRLSAAFRGSSVNLEALDQILQSITAPCSDEYKLPDAEEDNTAEAEEKTTKLKKSSFVTVESIKEARDRLRRTTSPVIDDKVHKKGMDPNGKQIDDDGIVTEISKISPNTSKVRSYIYGMENSLSKKSTTGTGSLESRSKHLNNASVNKNEDWYNRRKSYGFEKMYNTQDDNIAKNKTADSSTDSGICRSSEITMHTLEESKNSSEHYIHDDDSALNPNGYDLNKDKWISDIERTAIGIPIVSQNTWKLFGKEFASESNDELKRHSIAVDESKYVIKSAEPKFRRTSLAVNCSDLPHLSNDADSFLQNRRPKKVEFCKTEVHFTAESGRVNIVETDEKPPPTNNFRRRRRNSGLLLESECGKSNGLPMFKFGDDISNDENNAEDFCNEDDTSHNPNTVGLVTVNSSRNGAQHQYIDEDPKENNLDIDLPRGILKNKPAKPKRYILGDNENYLSNNLDNLQTSHNPWDVRLNPVKTEAPMWRSTVKVKSTPFTDGDRAVDEPSDVDDDFGKNDGDLTEFQKLLKNLKPISTRTSENKPSESISDSFNGIRILSPSLPDTRPIPWSSSVMDRIKRAEDQQQHLMENKGYSTKVNIGNGEATVIENNTNKRVNKHPTWPRKEETSHDVVRKQILNRGLVVRIGRDDTNSKHTVCSKTTTNRNDTSSTTTTTTKITIDLTPLPSSTNDELNFQSVRFLPRVAPSHHDFKSASLILNTLKTDDDSAANVTQKGQNDLDVKLPKIPEQLEALRRLYEDADSGSETDKEVQSFMSRSRDADRIDEECSSVVSGSWSRVSAFKNMAHFKKNVKSVAAAAATTTKTTTSTKHQRNDLHAHLEKDLDRMQGVIDTKATRLLAAEGFEKQGIQEKRNRVGQIKNDTKTNHPSSMAALHKTYFPSSPIESRTKFDITDKLSSPALVGKSTLQNQTFCDSSTVGETFVSKSKFSSEKLISKRNSLDRQTNKASESIATQHKIRNRSPGKEVLRQPKKSEMAYFGVPVSPQTTKKQPKHSNLSERPDLLQFASGNKDSSVDVEESIYENVESVKKKQATVALTRGKREFDSSILEELTRAADQILQAVNGYTDEDSENNKNLHLRKPLDTISETKSWKQQNPKAVSTRPTQVKSNSAKTKVKPTSSNSSVESVHREARKSSGHRLSASTSSVEAKKVTRKVTNGDNDATTNATATATRANVKARRLQRASSREALLQSHGSSSEDLPVVVEVPLRKPRLVRKSKNTNSTADNSLERKAKPPGNVATKREDSSSKSKSDTRVPVAGLPEIRHKTAVSTIRSTAERAAAREKTEKSKMSESKRKPLQKRDPRGMPAAVTLRSDKNKNSTGRENGGQSQRAATANVKKCIRYDAS